MSNKERFHVTVSFVYDPECSPLTRDELWKELGGRVVINTRLLGIDGKVISVRAKPIKPALARKGE